MTPPRDCAPLLRSIGLDAMASWAEERPVRHGWKGRTCRDLWAAAPKGEWLIQYAEEAGVDSTMQVRAAAACARLALDGIDDAPTRSAAVKGVEAAERWADEPSHDARRKAWEAGMRLDGITSERRAMSGWGRHEPMRSAVDAARYSATAAGIAVERDRPMLAATSASAAERAILTSAVEGRLRFEQEHYYGEHECADAVRRLIPFLELPRTG